MSNHLIPSDHTKHPNISIDIRLAISAITDPQVLTDMITNEIKVLSPNVAFHSSQAILDASIAVTTSINATCSEKLKSRPGKMRKPALCEELIQFITKNISQNLIPLAPSIALIIESTVSQEHISRFEKSPDLLRRQIVCALVKISTTQLSEIKYNFSDAAAALSILIGPRHLPPSFLPFLESFTPLPGELTLAPISQDYWISHYTEALSPSFPKLTPLLAVLIVEHPFWDAGIYPTDTQELLPYADEAAEFLGAKIYQKLYAAGEQGGQIHFSPRGLPGHPQ